MNARAPIPQSELVPLEAVRTRLATLWFGTSGVIVAILAIQSLMNKYETFTSDAWGWLLPTLLPCDALILTVLAYFALDSQNSGVLVRRSFVPVAFWISAFYLGLVTLTLFSIAATHALPEKAIGMMKTSNLWLGPIQGLVTSALGALFFSKQKR